jgi:hypothetical protein
MGNTRHGPLLDRWTPKGSGPDFTLNAITKPLEPYRKYVTSFGNIKNEAAASVHVGNPGTWLTAQRQDVNAPHLFVSVDQVIADRIGRTTPHHSLQISSETTVQQAAGNGNALAITLSFRDANTPLQMEFNPRKIFVQLFGDKKRVASLKETASLLDLFTEQARALEPELGPGDRAVLENYLDAVREAEKSVAAKQESLRNLEGLQLPPMPPGQLDEFDQQVDLMFDLIALAYRADLTRVVSFIMVAEGSNVQYPFIGVRESFHPLSHHADDLDRINKLVKIQTWHMDRFAAFLGKLAAVPDGEGTLLDNAMFLYGSNMSNSSTHSHFPLPTLLVGGGAGNLTGGRHIDFPAATPIANLHLTLLGKAGIERQTFADSTGTISL